MTTSWYNQLDNFGRRLLSEIPGAWDGFHTGLYNPVTRALKDSDFVEKYKSLPGFNRVAVCRVAVICQMAVFDKQGGPEGDGRPKALRRHWYSYFKSEVAQPLAMQLGDYIVNSQGVKEITDDDWVSRLSQTYAELVDSGEVTYKDLWVEDASRMVERIWRPLFEGLNLMICVEKDSLFEDFKAAAEAIGARALYSGKGKSSKAAIEKVLREAFGWSEWNNPFTTGTPLVVLHISDYDYDGEAVIGPTFGEQCTRYSDYIYEARIGIEPEDVLNVGRTWEDAWYSIKVSNKGYQDWAEVKAIYKSTCQNCRTEFSIEGRDGHHCPECGDPVSLSKDSTPHGFEVEALRTRDYYTLIADALMRVVPFEYIVSKLREECTADSRKAVNMVTSEIINRNHYYQGLLREFDRLNAIKAEFERKVEQALEDVVEGHESDWEDEEEDPTPDDLKAHLEEAATRGWGTVWRPFSSELRTQRMVDWVRESQVELLDKLANEAITW